MFGQFCNRSGVPPAAPVAVCLDPRAGWAVRSRAVNVPAVWADVDRAGTRARVVMGVSTRAVWMRENADSGVLPGG